MENENIKKVIHDSKALITILSKENIELKGLEFDTAIAAYLLDSSKGKYELNSLISRYLLEDVEEDNFFNLSFYIKPLYLKLKELISKDNMDELYYTIELPLV